MDICSGSQGSDCSSLEEKEEEEEEEEERVPCRPSLPTAAGPASPPPEAARGMLGTPAAQTSEWLRGWMSPHHSSEASAVISAGSDAPCRPAGRPGSALSTPQLVVQDLDP